MSEFSVSDYNIFSDGISTAKSLSTSVDSSMNNITKYKNELNNENIFMGPMCNDCIASLDNVNSKLDTMISSYDKIAEYLNVAMESYKKGDSEASEKIQLRSTVPATGSVTGTLALNGNVVDLSNPVEKGNKYNLSDDDLAYLANVAIREQGTLGGAKMELSLMANLYEQNKSKYSDVKDYVANSGWFASRSLSYDYPGDDYVEAAREVLNDGNLYLPSNVNEHDCISDISYISTGDASNRDNYIPGETVIHNVYGATYVFVGFAPDGGDPFGYKIKKN